MNTHVLEYLYMEASGPMVPISMICPNGYIDPEDRLDMILDQMRTMLRCELVEHVSVQFLNSARDMFVDEEGKLKGLPVNDAATHIYQTYALEQNPHLDPDDLNKIYGPAVVFQERVWL
jgi:hypothetical protein